MKIFYYPSTAAQKKIESIINRGFSFKKIEYDNVAGILEDVRKKGDVALIKYSKLFDCKKLSSKNLTVTKKEIEVAENQVEKSFIVALNKAISQITSFHKQQITHSWIKAARPGVMLGQIVNPVAAAGIYVPGAKGGKTPLVSSVLMGAIPAKIAGVNHIAMVTPPTKDGSINPHLLVAAKKTGVDAIYKIGSAWAVAALAYGTKTIPKVDVIVGPGNIYVTIAKKIVSGIVGIDLVAGPSEVLIIADATADSEFIAADMLSQSEHDILASSMLITTSKDLAVSVLTSLKAQLQDISRKEIAKKSLSRFGGIIVVPNVDTAIDIANKFAPEHLELQIKKPFDYIGKIHNAGAVFIGKYTPEPVGDYMAGPNHVLPTAGSARFASALSVDNFIKKTSLISYNETAFRNEAKHIQCLASIEGLDAHAKSITVRLKHK